MKNTLLQVSWKHEGKPVRVRTRGKPRRKERFYGAKSCCDMQSNAGWRVHPLSSVSVREAHEAIPGNGGSLCVPVLPEMQT